MPLVCACVSSSSTSSSSPSSSSFVSISQQVNRADLVLQVALFHKDKLWDKERHREKLVISREAEPSQRRRLDRRRLAASQAPGVDGSRVHSSERVPGELPDLLASGARKEREGSDDQGGSAGWALLLGFVFVLTRWLWVESEAFRWKAEVGMGRV